jgi:hypothetical protein
LPPFSISEEEEKEKKKPEETANGKDGGMMGMVKWT